jgi:hypothetical protein
MIVINDCSLTAFRWWGGAELNARMLTESELDMLDDMLIELYPNGMSETLINDIMWFEFDFVCDLLGLAYDADHDEIIREEE